MTPCQKTVVKLLALRYIWGKLNKADKVLSLCYQRCTALIRYLIICVNCCLYLPFVRSVNRDAKTFFHLLYAFWLNHACDNKCEVIQNKQFCFFSKKYNWKNWKTVKVKPEVKVKMTASIRDQIRLNIWKSWLVRKRQPVRPTNPDFYTIHFPYKLLTKYCQKWFKFLTLNLSWIWITLFFFQWETRD